MEVRVDADLAVQEGLGGLVEVCVSRTGITELRGAASTLRRELARDKTGQPDTARVVCLSISTHNQGKGLTVSTWNKAVSFAKNQRSSPGLTILPSRYRLLGSPSPGVGNRLLCP
jgi:hypothetical protein